MEETKTNERSSSQHPLRFIFHIGAGKTGTSSIQRTLAANADVLRSQGYWYLGQMLERADALIYPWQRAAAAEQFHSMDASTASAQLSEVIQSTVDDARRKGIHTLIWSNESFFKRHQKTHAPLSMLQHRGVQISIVAYVRRHDAWAQAAYMQWGIKHKIDEGPIQPFRSWIEKRWPSFVSSLDELDRVFPGCLAVRNFDAVEDAVTDFLEIAKLPSADIRPVRSNDTLTHAELLLRAIYNGQFFDKVHPTRFDESIGKLEGMHETPIAHLLRLMPSHRDLQAVVERCKEDREALDKRLASQNQSPIDTSTLTPYGSSLCVDSLTNILCHLVVSQAMRLKDLETVVHDLKEREKSQREE